MKRTRLIFAGGLSAVLMFAAGGEPAAKPIDQSQPAKRIQVDVGDVVPLNVRLRFTTLIVLPQSENILDFVCGDKDQWMVEGKLNFAFVKPSKAQGQTNLNLITASGNIYSFILTEGSSANPDLKVFIDATGSMLSSSDNKPRFVAASELDDFRAQVDLARMQATEAKKQAAEELATKTAQLNAEVSKLKAELPHELRFDYKFTNEAPFNVESIFSDGKFTFIKANPQELPSAYELKDGRENLVEFRFENGLYVFTKVLDRGWLRIGKKRLDFERKGS
jgi:type IV secretory pathway VirB9-like protein